MTDDGNGVSVPCQGAAPDNKWQLIDERKAVQKHEDQKTSQEVSDYRRTAKLNRWFDCVHWPWLPGGRRRLGKTS